MSAHFFSAMLAIITVVNHLAAGARHSAPFIGVNAPTLPALPDTAAISDD
jgi:hypothetical protein